jgi:hypothetical protein
VRFWMKKSARWRVGAKSEVRGRIFGEEEEVSVLNGIRSYPVNTVHVNDRKFPRASLFVLPLWGGLICLGSRLGLRQWQERRSSVIGNVLASVLGVLGGMRRK